jgi:serine/threonine protein kinase
MKEFCTVQKLCEPGVHKNVVTVLNCGKLSPSHWFIDMELCQLNLGTYILRKWTPLLKQSVPFLTEIPSSSATTEISQMGDVMKDIGGGVEFIHSHEMIHRDLKPQNGILLLSSS